MSKTPRAFFAFIITIFSIASLSMSHVIPRAAFVADAQTSSSNIVISQVYGGGGNSGATLRNDFIELFNRGTSPVNLAGYSVQYTSATGTFTTGNTFVIPSGTIQPGGYFLIQAAQGSGGSQDLPTPDATSTLALSGTNGKVALVTNGDAIGAVCPADNSATVIDLVAYGSASNCNNRGTTAALSNTTAALRKSNGCTDTDSNTTDFDVAAPAPRNSSSPANPCDTSTPTTLAANGTANPNSVEQGATTLLTVNVTPAANPSSTGITVTGNLTSIGGSATQNFFDDGTNGDATAGDNIFSFNAVVAVDTATGAKSLPVNVADAQARTAATNINLTVQSSSATVTPINQIQGSGLVSPFAGQVVTTTGIVTRINFNPDTSSADAGFFIQTPDAEQDADSRTSEGVYVFTASAPQVAVGDAVRVRGTVSEFFSFTQIGSSPTVTVVSNNNTLPTPVALTPNILNPAGTLTQLEPYEGMRVQASSFLAVSPSNNFNEFFAVLNVNSRSRGFTRTRTLKRRDFSSRVQPTPRPFREPGIPISESLPPGAPANVPRFDENPERILVDLGDNGIPRPPAVVAGAIISGSEVNNPSATPLVGVLDYSFGNYRFIVTSGYSVPAGLRATPVPELTANEFTIGSFNLENFYVTASDFSIRVVKASKVIRDVMRAPDIIGVQEVGDLQTLQALAERIDEGATAAGQTMPNYQAYLIEGDDDTQADIDVGFLVKPARVIVTNVTQEGRNATYLNPISGQQELTNDRPPFVLTALVVAPDGAPAFPVTVIVNHLRSLIDVDDDGTNGEGARVRAKRRAGAEFLANLINARQTANPNERIVSVGDYNAFQFNDGYVDVIGTILGTPAPSDQVTLASSDLVEPNLFDLVETLPASQRYSFVFEGNAQVLDHIIVNQAARARVTRFAYGRNNADFPEAFKTDASRSERVSDHDLPVAYFSLAP